MDNLSIGRLAQQGGVGIDTIRFYEREGLLPEPPRLASGYRRYAPDALHRLRFIRRAKTLGFTLSEIAELLGLSQRRGSDARGVKTAAQAKLDRIDKQIKDLQRMRRGLRQLIEACPGQVGLQDCPILKALNHGGSDD
ncbi:MAG: MerR family DNA-binding protein [Nevskia sp.]